MRIAWHLLAPEVSRMDLCPHTVQSQPQLYKPQNPVRGPGRTVRREARIPGPEPQVLHCNRTSQFAVGGGRMALLPGKGCCQLLPGTF